MLALNDFTAVEKQVIEAYRSAVERFDRLETTELQFAEQLARDVLPPWRAFRARIQGAAAVPPGKEVWWANFREFLQTRQEYWEMLEKGYRTGDADLIRAAVKKSERAEQLLQQLQKEKAG
jgi:hypothetical protein